MCKQVLMLLACLGSIAGQAQNQYPQLREIVTDSAAIFSVSQLSELQEKLTAFETETSNQLVVVTIEQLGFETIESYANGLFNQNGLGQKGKDNGLLILFSKVDKEVRIEVGYGLEPYITDAVASRIIRNTMIPNFKEGRYFEGISLATDHLIRFLTTPEALEEFKAEIEHDEKINERIGYGFLFFFVAVFGGFGGYYFYRAYRNIVEVFRGIFIGKLGAVPGLFMVLAGTLSSVFGLIFMAAPAIAVFNMYKPDVLMVQTLIAEPKLAFWLLLPFFGIAILIALVQIAFFNTKHEVFAFSWFKNDSGYYRKTFSSSGTHSFGSGSSSGSSGGSSGGFSGGGGSSGGGGASGSW